MRWRESLIARCCRRATRRSGLVLAVAAALLALGVRAQGGRQDDRFSPEPVEVRIGGSVYAIPRNYLLYVSTAIDGKTANIVMRALWPGLEPLREDNAHLWDRRRPERQIHFLLMRQARDGYRQLQGLAELRKIETEPFAYRLTRHRSKLIEYYVGDTFVRRRSDGNPIALSCSDYPDSTKSVFDVKRTCTVEYPLDDGVGLHYRFFMVNLDQWSAIDQSVGTLVESFRQEDRR